MRANHPPKNGVPMSTTLTRAALYRLCMCYTPHACGGFTLDDILWEMRAPFGDISRAMDDMIEAHELVFMGYADGNDEDGCWSLRGAPIRIPIHAAREEAPF